MTFSRKGKRVGARVLKTGVKSDKSAEEVVREIKEGMKKPPGEDYRERSLAIHGLVCARCGREFDHTNRHLLTVHHKDGNHHNNPPDGNNWENLCLYCHDDVHSRELLGDYFGGSGSELASRAVYTGEHDLKGSNSGLGTLGRKLEEVMKKKKKV